MKKILPLLAAIGIVTLLVVGVIVYKYITRPPLTYNELVKLQEQGEAAASEIPLIVSCFDYNDETLRAQAAETLSKIGPKSVDPVRAQLKSSNAKTRFWAVQTLALLGPEAAGAADDLVPLLKDADVSVRYKTVYALGKLGTKSAPVIDGIVKALDDEDKTVSSMAVDVLDKIGTPPKKALPTVADLAANGSTSAVRKAALKLLGQMGEPAVPTFRALLKGMKENDRQDVFQAIAQLGPDAKGLVPELVPILTQQCRGPSIDPTLIEILKKCNGAGAKGLAEVLKAVEGELVAWGSRVSLYQAIGEMRSPTSAKASVPILVELLQSKKSVMNRPQILEALGEIGVPARDAIPAVEALTSDPAMGEAARVALRRMGKIVK